MRKRSAALTSAVGLMVLMVIAVLSLHAGAAKISWHEIMEALTAFDASDTMHLIVVDMRLPRLLAGMLVGAALAVSGAVMQGMTQNPMADSGLLGLSSGAGFAVSLCMSVLGVNSQLGLLLGSFLGALAGAGMVYLISALVPGHQMSLKLVLSGAMVSTFLSALSQALALKAGKAQSVMFWTLGSLGGITWQQVCTGAPFILAGLVLAFALSRKITLLSVTEEVAKGLGVNILLVKSLGTLAVVLLSGVSFVLAGSITFVGILTAHFCRFLVGADYRKIIPLSALSGAVLLTLSDILAKGFNPPVEYPVGTFIALVGVPVFLFYARRK